MPSSACKKYALRSEEDTSELQSHDNFVCRLLLEKKNSLSIQGRGTYFLTSRLWKKSTGVTSCRADNFGGLSVMTTLKFFFKASRAPGMYAPPPLLENPI